MAYHGLSGEYYMFSNTRGSVHGVHIGSVKSLGHACERAFDHFYGNIS